MTDKFLDRILDEAEDVDYTKGHVGDMFYNDWKTARDSGDFVTGPDGVEYAIRLASPGTLSTFEVIPSRKQNSSRGGYDSAEDVAAGIFNAIYSGVTGQSLSTYRRQMISKEDISSPERAKKLLKIMEEWVPLVTKINNICKALRRVEH